jgi:hypothetical protein
MIGSRPFPFDAAGTGRRLLLGAALAFGLAPAMAAGLPTIAVMEFELVDEQQELAPAKSEYGRLEGLTALLRTELESRGIYRIVDVAPAQPMIDELRARQNLRECNGCELDIGRALKADRVLLGWVQKVSNLILNVNIRIEDVATGRVVLQKSVDIRSNTEDSWRRGVRTLVNDMIDRGQIGR